MLCNTCGGTGTVLGFGAMKIPCPECKGLRFRVDQADKLLQEQRVDLKAASMPLKQKGNKHGR